MSPRDTEEYRAAIREELQPLLAAVGRLGALLDGGDDPAKGIIVRVDRLEQTEQSRKFWLTTAVSSGLLGGIASAWHWLRSVG